jgi:hypothetical protein
MKAIPWNRSAAAIAACLLLTLAVLVLATGCEAVFTASLFSFLQRDPSTLSPEQQVNWAEQALASGDPAAMAAGYAAIKDRAEASSDAELTYLAARLALELSGASAMLTAVLTEEAELTNETDIEEIFGTLNAAYLAEAGDFYQATHSNDETLLSGTDFILACMCLLFEAVRVNGGDAGVGAVYADVQSFAAEGVLAVGADDPAYDILDELTTFAV